MADTTMHRRRYLVSLRHQIPHAIGIAILAGVNSLLLLFVLAWVFLFRMEGRFEAPVSEGFLVDIMLVLAATAIVSAVWSLRHTRALAGLLHKVTKVLEDAQYGRIPAGEVIRFRKGDYEFCNLERELNNTVRKLRNSTPAPVDILQSLEKLEDDLWNEKLSPQDAATHVRAIRQRLAEGGNHA